MRSSTPAQYEKNRSSGKAGGRNVSAHNPSASASSRSSSKGRRSLESVERSLRARNWHCNLPFRCKPFSAARNDASNTEEDEEDEEDPSEEEDEDNEDDNEA